MVLIFSKSKIYDNITYQYYNNIQKCGLCEARVAGLKSLADHEQSVEYKSTTIKTLWPGPNVIKLFTAVIYEC